MSKAQQLIDLRIYYNPLDLKDVQAEHLAWREDATLGDYLEGLPEDVTWLVFVNGNEVDRHAEASRSLRPGDRLSLFVVPEGGDGFKSVMRLVVMAAAATIAAISGQWYVVAAVTLGAGLINTFLLTPKQRVADNGDGDQSYGIDGAKNSATENIPVPIVYGRYRQAGNFSDVFTENVGDDQYLYLRSILADGRVKSISQVEVNEQPVENFSNVEVRTSLGELDPPVNDWFNRTVRQVNKNVKLNPGQWVEHVTTDQIDQARFDVVFPQGLVDIKKKDGSHRSRTVTFRVEHRLLGSATYQPLDVPVAQEEVLDDKPATHTTPGGVNGIAAHVSIARTDLAQMGDNDTIALEYAPSGTNNWQTGAELTKSEIALQQGVESFAGVDLGFGNIDYINTSFDIPTLPTGAYDIRVSAGGINSVTSFSSGGTFSVSAARTTAVRRSFYTAKLPKGTYEVRIIRDTPDAGSQYIIDEVWLSDVAEIENDAIKLSGLATVSLKIKLTDQLNGIPSMTALVEGSVVKQYDDAGNVVAEDFSANPAWIFADMHCGEARGAGFPASRLDWPAIVDWAEENDAKGIEFNGVFSEESTLHDAIETICRVGHAAPIDVGTKRSITIDRPRDPVQVFTSANMIENTFSIGYMPVTDRANEFEAVYYDKNDRNKAKTIRYVDPKAVQFNEVARAAQLDLRGIDNQAAAAKELWRQIYANRLLMRTGSFDAYVDSISCTIGDVILIQTNRMEWSQGGLLRTGSTASELVLDQVVPFESGKNYSVIVQHDALKVSEAQVQGKVGQVLTIATSDDLMTIKPTRLIVGSQDFEIITIKEVGLAYSVLVNGADLSAVNIGTQTELWKTDVIEERVVTAVDSGDDYNSTVTVSQPFSQAPTQYSRFIFGETQKVMQKYTVLGIDGEGVERRTLSFIEYDERVYAPGETDIEVPIEPLNDRQVNQVRSLRVSYDKVAKVNQQTVDCLVEWNAGHIQNFAGADVWARINGGEWRSLGTSLNVSQYSFKASVGDVYEVRVVAFNRRGDRAPVNQAPSVKTTIQIEADADDSVQIRYPDGVPIEERQPAERDATKGAPPGTPVGGMESSLLVQKVVQVDTDLEDAKTQIDDLFATYGSTASAAASAQQALAATQASEAFKLASEGARDASVAARDIANSAAGAAADARSQAQAARDIAQQEAAKAFLDAQAAAGSAGTAAGHAQTASSKADEATGAASAANASAILANSKAGEAQGFASAAALSASSAATQASDAGSFASSANSSALTAQAAATLLAPSTFKDGGTYFSHIIGDEDTASRPEQAFSNISYPVTPDYGRVLRTADVLMGYTHVSFRRRIRPTEHSRRFRVTVRARMLSNPAQGNALLVAAVYGLTDNWQTLCYGGWDDQYDTSQALARPTVASGIVTVSMEFSLRQNPGPDVNGNIPTNGVTAGCYITNEANPLGWSAGSIEILSMELADVTEQRNAELAANASATSAANAAASETVAGQRASAAQQSALEASTFAGNASTFASQAATSASNAAGSANTATSQAGLAAEARDRASDFATSASNSASAANTSAGLASASQSAAGSSASAAQSAQLSAEAARETTRDIIQRQWPNSFSPEGRLAYGGLDTGFGQVENAPASPGAWPDAYAWHNLTSDPANSRYIWLRKSRPTVTGRRLRASCWVWHDMDPATDIRFQLYAQSGPSVENSGAVYNGAGGSITNQVPRFVWTKITGEYLIDSTWQAHHTFSLEVIRLTPAPFGCNWYVTGFTIEDITSEYQSAQSAAASLSSAQSASASQSAAGASAQAADASRLAAEAANGSAQGAASVANARAVAADASASSAASSATLSAQYRDQAQGSASAAATSATVADGHRSAAATSANLASTFQTGSAVAASAAFPSTFENEGTFFSFLTGDEYSAARPEVAYSSSITYPVRGDVGKVLRVSYSAGYTHIAVRKRIPRSSTRRYRLTARCQVLVNGPLTLNYLVATCYGLTPDYQTITYDGVSYAAIPGLPQGINANTGSGIFDIGIDFWAGPTSSNTAWIVPSIYIVGTNGSGTFGETGVVDVFNIKVEDVTSEVEAQTFANAASNSATLADGHRSSAATSASLSAGYRDEALGHRNSAQSFASQASGAAAAASASESTTLSYVTQASSFGVQSLMKNSFFATPGWTAWVPPSWLLWANENSPFIGPYPQNASRPNPYGPNALQIDRNSGAAGIRQGTGPLGAGWYVAEAEAWVEDGTWAGVGMHFSFNNGYSGNLDFGVDPDTNEQVFAGTSFRNRKFSKLFWNGADSNGLDLYLMAGWGGFASWSSASGFARTIWHKALVRPATQQEIQARRAFENAAANTAQISSVNSTLTTAISALAARTTTVEARYDGLPGYNRLPSSEIINLRTSGWQSGASHGGYTLGVNGAGEFWKPRGENVLSIHQLGRVGSESYGFWVSDHFSVTPGEWLQHYVFFASHRASCEIFVDFWDQSGNFTGQYGGFTGRIYNGDNGGPDPGQYVRLGVKSYQVPSGAVTARLVMRKYDTFEGHGDSWAWFWRPYVGAARPGQNDWNPYQASSGRALAGAIEARTTVTEGAIADINGAAAFYEVVTAASGSNPAIVSLKAGKNGSTINLAGDRVIIRNPVNGEQVEVARFENGVAQLNSAMIRRLRVAARSNSQIFLPVMLRPIIRLGSDGQWVQYQNGDSFGASPERITPDLNGLPALAAGESYDVRAINITDTGFTAYAKKITASEPVAAQSSTGVNVGGLPQWRAEKLSALDAYNGNYQFTVNIIGQLLSSEPAPGGAIYEWAASGDLYIADINGNMVKVGSYNEFWGGFNVFSSRTITVTVNTSMTVGVGGYKFGVHPTGGGVSGFPGVFYATQVQTNVAPISAPISWVVSPPVPD